jgi:hypothetical protein
MSSSETPEFSDGPPQAPGGQAGTSEGPIDDIADMVSQYRREVESASRTKEFKLREMWPFRVGRKGTLFVRWIVSVALHPEWTFYDSPSRQPADPPSDAPGALTHVCRHCHAAIDPEASKCWRCNCVDSKSNPLHGVLKPSKSPALMSFGETLLTLLAVAILGSVVVWLDPRLGLVLLISAASAWMWKFVQEEWKKGEQSPFFVVILPWILLPALIFVVLPLTLIIGSVVALLRYLGYF